jgi:Zn-dependent protease
MDLSLAVVWYVVFVYSVVYHEAAHAFAALKLGDSTAYEGGQVTLDPTPHMRRAPFGMIFVPWLGYFLGGTMLGWAHIPVNRYWVERFPVRAGWMALAGPAANLSVVIGVVLIMKLGIAQGWLELADRINGLDRLVLATEGGSNMEMLATLLSVVFNLNLLLVVLNLVPIPPFDGASVVMIFLPRAWADGYLAWLHNPQAGMIGALIAFKGVGELIGPVKILFLKLLFGVSYL